MKQKVSISTEIYENYIQRYVNKLISIDYYFFCFFRFFFFFLIFLIFFLLSSCPFTIFNDKIEEGNFEKDLISDTWNICGTVLGRPLFDTFFVSSANIFEMLSCICYKFLTFVFLFLFLFFFFCLFFFKQFFYFLFFFSLCSCCRIFFSISLVIDFSSLHFTHLSFVTNRFGIQLLGPWNTVVNRT